VSLVNRPATAAWYARFLRSARSCGSAEPASVAATSFFGSSASALMRPSTSAGSMTCRRRLPEFRADDVHSYRSRSAGMGTSCFPLGVTTTGTSPASIHLCRAVWLTPIKRAASDRETLPPNSRSRCERTATMSRKSGAERSARRRRTMSSKSRCLRWIEGTRQAYPKLQGKRSILKLWRQVGPYRFSRKATVGRSRLPVSGRPGPAARGRTRRRRSRPVRGRVRRASSARAQRVSWPSPRSRRGRRLSLHLSGRG
jgi:hypothetical protein